VFYPLQGIWARLEPEVTIADLVDDYLQIALTAGEGERVKDLEARLAELQQTVLLGCKERTALQNQLAQLADDTPPVSWLNLMVSMIIS